jgi:hypothetical protein
MNVLRNPRPSHATAKLALTPRLRLRAAPSTHLQRPIYKTTSARHTAAGLSNYAPSLVPPRSPQPQRSNLHNHRAASRGSGFELSATPVAETCRAISARRASQKPKHPKPFPAVANYVQFPRKRAFTSIPSSGHTHYDLTPRSAWSLGSPTGSKAMDPYVRKGR